MNKHPHSDMPPHIYENGLMGHPNQTNSNKGFSLRRLNAECYWMKCPMHATRSQMHCFFYLSKGTVLVDIRDKTYLIKANEFIIVPAGQKFAVRYYNDCEGYMGGFNNSFFLEEQVGGNIIKRFDFLRLWGYPKIEFTAEINNRINTLFSFIYKEVQDNNTNFETIRAYLIPILVEADNIYKKDIKQIVFKEDNICNKFLEILFSQIGQRLNVIEYAKQLNISPNHLNKVVKKITSKSPSVWIEEVMMLDAKVLLRNTDMPLSEIAAKVGTLDQSYFTRRFKMNEGITPTQYRQKFLKK